ncbi:class A beta-lactamase-related serine hydrolase [Fibrisoma montanum]|uniref:Class A beta-lactamase-related serine hydrolase n=1 Tax=Fibrisoma montanum TaxID=2305895 RepID=A0A418M295_9BACT|nr:serine hydrolase domain-containing protein [Fibrisoma montanum]RIV19853.1 class A beta-lactamase-related serine hydrolase [Fibrisoma montanum]
MSKLFPVLCFLFVFPAFGQPRPTGEPLRDKAYRTAIQRAQRFVDSLRLKQDIPGVSVCVGTRDRLLWAEGVGYADLEARLPVTTQTMFRIGSVSKSLTSLAVGKLVEEGKLDLDAPAQQYVPGFPQKKYPITSRQLATHTAGIRHYGMNDGLECLKRYRTVQEGLAIFRNDSLLFKPGTAYNYSTYGYSLLSAVIEGAGGTDYLTYMQQTVFSPLGLTNTGADYSDSIVLNRVRFYEHQNRRLVNATQVDNSYKWAGGGLLSTPTDLVRVGQALLKGTHLKPQTVALLFTPQRLLNGTNTNYGFGWRIGTDSKGRNVVHHGGTIDGGRTFLLLYPDNDLIVALTANMSGVSINLPEMEAIATYFLGANRVSTNATN